MLVPINEYRKNKKFKTGDILVRRMGNHQFPQLLCHVCKQHKIYENQDDSILDVKLIASNGEEINSRIHLDRITPSTWFVFQGTRVEKNQLLFLDKLENA